jgi:hypothetical protein
MKKRPLKRRMTHRTFEQVLYVSDVLQELAGRLEREGIAFDTAALRATADMLDEL